MDDLMKQLAAEYRAWDMPHPGLKAVTLAQWLLESGRGTSALAREHLNFGGLKWRAEMTPYAKPVKYRAHDGVDAYCGFATLRYFLAGYWAFLGRWPYVGWQTHSGSAEAFIRHVGAAYNPNPGYADRVLALLPEAEALLRATGRDLGVIVLDPGHGGAAPLPGSSANNATSVSGVPEKTLTLGFGFVLKDALERQAAQSGDRVRVALTRDRDVNVAGADRAGLAGRLGARAFLSLHFNGAADAKVRGCETFYRANGIAEALAAGFARTVQAGLTAGWCAIDAGARDRGAKPDTLSGPGGLGVLNDRSLGNIGRAAPCVAALAEVEFITNPSVDRLIVSGEAAEANRRAIAAPMAHALLDWLRRPET